MGKGKFIVNMNNINPYGFTTTGRGPQASGQLPYKCLNSMVYDRYSELVNGSSLFLWCINQQTNWGAHPILIVKIIPFE